MAGSLQTESPRLKLRPTSRCNRRAARSGSWLDHEHLTLQDPEVVEGALRNFSARPSVGFSDALLLELARKAGHLPLGTCDRDLGRLRDAEKL